MSPARRKLSNAIHPADFDHIAAGLRQCAIFPGYRHSGARVSREPESRDRMTRLDSGFARASARAPRNDGGSYQLRLNPAEMLLFAVPCGVSPIEPETLTPPNSFCSAPILRSHLSSVEDRLWPATRLVPVSAMLSRRRLIHRVLRAWCPVMPGIGGDALLGDAAAVLQRERSLLVQRHRLAQRGAEPALLLRWIDPRLDRGPVPDRAHAGRGHCRPCRAGGLLLAGGDFLLQRLGGGQGLLPGDGEIGADPGIPKRNHRLLDRQCGRAIGFVLRRPG